MWKSAALGLEKAGYRLTADLLRAASSKNTQSFYVGEGSYASNLIKNDKGITSVIKNVIRNESIQGKSKFSKKIDEYIIPLKNGDLGASLHRVSIDIKAKMLRDGKWNVDAIVSGTFDFTEKVAFWKKDSFLEKVLWAANDVAYFSQKADFTRPIKFKIQFNDTYKIWKD